MNYINAIPFDRGMIINKKEEEFKKIYIYQYVQAHNKYSIIQHNSTA